jgi:hypothetical protein
MLATGYGGVCDARVRSRSQASRSCFGSHHRVQLSMIGRGCAARVRLILGYKVQCGCGVPSIFLVSGRRK